MKKILLTAGMSALLWSFSAQAATTLTGWTFDNLSIGINSSPQPSTGFGSAAALGMANSYNGTNSLSNPDIQSLPGSSTGNSGPNSWRIRGSGAAPSGGNGWSSQAPIGTQGAQFSASTFGYYRIMVSFDVYATPDAEANLQVEYTMDGNIWSNAPITSVGSLATITNNTATNSTVMGSYVILTNNGTTGWNNQITVDLSGVSGVDNDANFAIRIVNASTGTNCVDTTGAAYNNVSGSWTLDNVVVQGVAIDTIADWTFESYGTTNPVYNPIPELSAGNTTFAQALGFTTDFTFSDGSQGSTNDPDTLVQGGSSTPTGTICWRVRGQNPGNGWDSQSAIGTQGGEFDVSTLNYTNIVLTFDLYFTTQAEAKMQVEYTTDGVNWINCGNLSYSANPTFILNNPSSGPLHSDNTVVGAYFYQTTGQNWYNSLCVDFTGVTAADNNPNFGIRIVNATTGPDDLNYTGGSYNNSSGNCRFDNVQVGGHFEGSVPPPLTYDPNATVDRPFTNTFTDDPVWRSHITAVYVNGSLLPSSAYSTTTAGQIVYTPSASVLLQTAGTLNFVFFATGYSSDKVTQPLGAGAAKKLAITTQPAAPSASSGTLTVNPVLSVTDKYGNGTTNPYANISVTAATTTGETWTLGGATTQTASNGIMTFTNLSATLSGSTAKTKQTIYFTVTGYSNTTTVLTSAVFNISAPPVPFTPGNLAVFQIDTVANNTTFSMIEIKPATAGQTAPVNVVPISATAGTNSLRQSSAGSTGRLALSDDGTLLCFAAFADGSSATPDETLVLSRAVAGMNYSNVLNIAATYNSVSLGGSQARAAATLDDTNFFVDDKGGLYEGMGFLPAPNIDPYNNVVVKTFGGIPYVETQKTVNGSPIPVVYSLGYDNDTHVYDVQEPPSNLGTDPVATDFYMISTNAGSTFDVLYIMDQQNSSLAIIRKYSRIIDNTQLAGYYWETNGYFTNGSGGDGLFAATNGSGSVYLYYTTGGGGTAGNSIVRLTDAGSWHQPLDITTSNAIYKASKTTSIKGLTFVPQQIAYTNEVIPPPILIAQMFAPTNGTFAVTNVPDDPAWRTNITTITVNGTVLPTAAYDLTQIGQIVFDPTQSPLLQNPGAKTLVFSAPGFSTNSIVQIQTGPANRLLISTQPSGPAADGNLLGTQPVVFVGDALSNIVNSTATITGTAHQAGWILGGNNSLSAVGGSVTFTNLSAFSTVTNNVSIDFASTGLTGITSSTFPIPAPLHSVLHGSALSGSNFAFAFTNFPSLSFEVLGTNNLTSPLSNWPVLGSAVESPVGSGNYFFTNSGGATNSPQFYILRQP